INIGHDPAIRRAIAHALERVKPAPLEPEPRVEPVPPSKPAPAADVGDRAGTQPKKRRGTTGRPRETRDAAAKKMRAELSHSDLRKRLTPDELRNMKQVALAKRYDCGRETACKARDEVLSEIVGNRVSDK